MNCSTASGVMSTMERPEPLDMHIRTLRQKLGEEGGACIKTVRGVGYRMVR